MESNAIRPPGARKERAPAVPKFGIASGLHTGHAIAKVPTAPPKPAPVAPPSRDLLGRLFGAKVGAIKPMSIGDITRVT